MNQKNSNAGAGAAEAKDRKEDPRKGTCCDDIQAREAFADGFREGAEQTLRLKCLSLAVQMERGNERLAIPPNAEKCVEHALRFQRFVEEGK